jgi:hypothetical protein
MTLSAVVELVEPMIFSFGAVLCGVGVGTLDVGRGSLTSASPKMKTFRNAHKMRIMES